MARWRLLDGAWQDSLLWGCADATVIFLDLPFLLPVRCLLPSLLPLPFSFFLVQQHRKMENTVSKTYMCE